jgi:hypothetical protein
MTKINMIGTNYNHHQVEGYPPIYFTGSPCWVATTGTTLAGGAFAKSDEIFTFFKTELGCHISGLPVKHGQLVTAFGREAGPQSPSELDLKDGFDAQEKIYFGLKRGSEFFELIPDKEVFWQMIGRFRDIKDFALGEQIDIEETPYLYWFFRQAPVFSTIPNDPNSAVYHGYEIEEVVQVKINRYSWRAATITPRFVDLYPRGIGTRIRYCKEYWFEIIEGSGALAVSATRRRYTFGDGDIERGYVLLKWRATPFDTAEIYHEPCVYIRLTLQEKK